MGKKTYMRVWQITYLAPMIQRACEIYSIKYGLKLDYKGEGLGAMMLKGVQEDLITKRIKYDQATKDTLKEKQNGLCSECKEELEDGRYEVCHIIPRAASTGDEGKHLSNLTLKCKPCHAKATHTGDLSNHQQTSKFHTLASHPSPLIQDIFFRCGKPSQQVSGVGAEHVPRGQAVFEVDARGSRPNGIFEYPYKLPIFSPIDDPIPCTWTNGTWRRDPTVFDYIFCGLRQPI